MNNYYTYIYYDPSRNNEPIYVGKGRDSRAWSHLKRKGKHPLIQRLKLMERNQIIPIIGIYSGLDEELAHLIEEELISKFGRKDLGKGPLLNLTDGGEGPGGRKHSEAAKSKMSVAKIGKSTGPCLASTKEKISKSKKGVPGRKPSIEENIKRSNSLKGHITTQETKNKISLANKGREPFSKNRPMSEEQKIKMRVPRIKIECPYCGKIGGNSQMKRWHFDNCKEK